MCCHCVVVAMGCSLPEDPVMVSTPATGESEGCERRGEGGRRRGSKGGRYDDTGSGFKITCSKGTMYMYTRIHIIVHRMCTYACTVHVLLYSVCMHVHSYGMLFLSPSLPPSLPAADEECDSDGNTGHILRAPLH